jgi:hypothetical protein
VASTTCAAPFANSLGSARNGSRHADSSSTATPANGKGDRDPEILKRFRHFVNSDEPDAGVVFVAEREQIRPARPQERETDLEVA